MEIDFQRYLASKRTVDDRALNRPVWQAFADGLSALAEPRVLELGAGIGTMFQRMVDWGTLAHGDYTAIDEMPDNIHTAHEMLPAWGKRLGFEVGQPDGKHSLTRGGKTIHADFETAELYQFAGREAGKHTWDAIMAHAFLDLLELERGLAAIQNLLTLGGLLYTTLNFDGVTIFEPEIDRELDQLVVDLYHRSMDERLTDGRPSGDSRTGRHLFGVFQRAGFEILAAGSSDWVVFPQRGSYPADEAYFLNFMLHFVENSLRGRSEIESDRLDAWLNVRRAQVERGELVLIAHQYDFLTRAPKSVKINPL